MTRTRRIAVAWFLLAAVALGAVLVALVEQPSAASPAARIASLEREVRCLSCGELDVAQSKSAEAYSMAAFIRHEVAAGASNQQILDQLVATYGDAVLMAPPANGLGLYLWLLPVAVGAGIAWELVRGARRHRDPEELSGGRLGTDADEPAPQPSRRTGGGVGLALSPTAVAAAPSGEDERRARPRRLAVPKWAALVGGGLMLVAAGVGVGVAIGGSGGTAHTTATLGEDLRLGETLAAVGASAQAERAFEAALELAPTNPTALAYEGWLRFNTAHSSRARAAALAMLDEAAQLGPHVAVAQLFDGFGLFYGRHETAGALARLRAYLADAPSSKLSLEASPLAVPIYSAAHLAVPAPFRSRG
ncbi:cytochrome C biogenesis protein [Acidimicrobium ferrooxidans DSM 10331]|uniref:Cytochrome c-type biogenesis protein n=1 Tax=Acidimicrobium ferrooxidans (strain DSM 10331 / JCM 15462 / NBRC 103882 / ICP) TaxID=525909 RepID=C7M2R3_ACIFD|nr:cytochrome c-type biogenesis protein CcmH [Acidimicrobium ferrooxidans]ACU53307.1 cytochrome C biogenesis protein [Acidimicrobium ferrooxidans DSM 10331]